MTWWRFPLSQKLIPNHMAQWKRDEKREQQTTILGSWNNRRWKNFEIMVPKTTKNMTMPLIYLPEYDNEKVDITSKCAQYIVSCLHESSPASISPFSTLARGLRAWAAPPRGTGGPVPRYPKLAGYSPPLSTRPFLLDIECFLSCSSPLLYC